MGNRWCRTHTFVSAALTSLVLSFLVPAVAAAQIVPANPFNTGAYDGSIHENPTYDYLVAACDGDTDNAMSFDGAGVPVTDYPAIVQGVGETNTNGCNEGSAGIDGLLIAGTGGSTSGTQNRGVAGAWTLTAPAGTTITGLQYSDPTFEFPTREGLVSGWFGEIAGDSDGQQLAADHDPTQSYRDFHDDVPPTYDCVMQSLPSSCSVENDDTETFVFNTDPWTTSSTSAPALQEIALGFECRDDTCSYGQTTYAGVGSALFQIDDPAGAPAAGSASGGQASFDGRGASDSSGWLTASQVGATTFTTASDPGGICSLTVGLYNANGTPVDVDSDTQLAAPAIDAANGYFTSSHPCSDAGTAASAQYIPDAQTLASLPSGTYYLNAVAQSPAEYQQGVYSWYAGGTTNVDISPAGQGIPVRIDNTAPAVTIGGAANGWSSTAQTLTVTGTTGPSGVAGLTCDDGATVMTPTASVPGTDQITDTYTVTGDGAHSISCSVTSGVASSASAQASVQIDSQAPTITFSDSQQPTAAGWYSATQSVNAVASETDDLSGVGLLECEIDGKARVQTSTSSESLTVTGDGSHNISCQATTNAGVTSPTQTYTVKIDTETPTVNITGPPSGTYASGSAELSVSASDSGPSGIAEVDCEQDGGSYAPIDLNGDAGTFTLVGATGAHTADCYAVTNAGISSGAAPATYTVNFDDGDGDTTQLTKYGSSPLIDGGDDPYSDGPSQSSWSRSPEQVTITAEKSGGAAISAISCTGAGVQATYPNTSGTNAETTTVYVQPPGGTLTCYATDAANNTYPLGSYQFLIDDTPPTGMFVGQDSANLALVRVAAADAGSGVQKVEITFTCQSGPCLSANDGAPFPIQSEPAVLDQASGYWEADIPDTGAWPNGDYSLTATMTDLAGNAGTTSSFADGTTAGISLPARVLTTLDATVTGDGQTAPVQGDSVTPGATQTLPASRSRVQETAQRQPAADQRSDPNRVCTVEVKTLRKATAQEPAATRLRRSCTALAPAAARRAKPALTLSYDAHSVIHGQLIDHAGNTPIANATLVVYQRLLTGGKLQRIGTALTNANGQFSYHLKGGASRKVIVAYDGTAVMHPTAGFVSERFHGRVRIKVPRRTSAGQMLVILGHVYGGDLPADGVLVQPRYRVKGLGGGWAPFGNAVRTTPSGRFTIRIHLAAIAAGLTYQLDARVQAQTGYGYLTATSPTVTRKVRK